jgi:hypothetical protein
MVVHVVPELFDTWKLNTSFIERFVEYHIQNSTEEPQGILIKDGVISHEEALGEYLPCRLVAHTFSGECPIIGPDTGEPFAQSSFTPP